MAEKLVIERIDGAHMLPYFPDHLARYRFALQWAPQSRILDVCCGVGYGTFLLAACGARDALGIDISDEAIARAAQQPALPVLRFAQRDACTQYPDSGTWDLVTCFEGIEHVEKPELLLKCVFEALRPGGVAVLSTPNADAFPGGSSDNPFHLSEMPERKFRDLVGSLPWIQEWYAQSAVEFIWRRPRWQRTLIRMLPGWVRELRHRNPRPRDESRVRDTYRLIAPDLWKRDTDDWYPMPWDQAVRVLYSPPPEVMLVVAAQLDIAVDAYRMCCRLRLAPIEN